MDETVYTHENGYSAILYGKSSMTIFNADGKRIMHTGKRKCNTEKEVMELLERQPAFEEVFENMMEFVKDGIPTETK